MKKNKQDVVIVSAVRTAIGSFGGSLKPVRAHELGAVVIGEALKRAGVTGEMVSEVIMGDCVQCSDEFNTARSAMLKAGLPIEVPAFTIQRACSSAMTAVVTAAQQIKCGDAGIVVAGGVESMSNAPYALKSARWGQRLGHGELVDTMWEALHAASGLFGEPYIMGQTAENLAEKYGLTRQEQDEVALRSHQNAQAAIESGRFADEITPVMVPQRKGEPVVFDTDEHVRFNMTMDQLTRLKPAFKKDGTVTAGNASGINDGASAMVLMSREKAGELGLEPLATFIASGVAGVEPHLMGYGPAPATKKALARAGLGLEDIGLIEVNEAFAAQYLAVGKLLGLNREITNVNGSGVALGHPVGSTGCRIIVTLIHEMKKRGVETGLATLCAGGGMGTTVIVELG